ncbi:Rieske-like 2Fe-2S protein [Maritimibacter alkaliphilus HTCC2654]|uniref:Probable phenoxybenzoate dioxygenase alpha subunit n=1 Tax=Maritimibacter alkaliphilus HTCC2654 TaxID=314271 RepID=A3VLL4_9RHOB|nr:Rieske 2Fe-2S domain-containing protein [Maritimibacter alkaliphilus]EAQ10902.1 probable phenoxybenzoate dioxygenase alpha subunit [Rhodobacterales bacterium HTCC2654] [Maritimibacter alkaliphilus HTCC2654]TYP80453.1 Rieske-like 2Fe-2S protein [Maritimibacter alkaliphilus HTCC2654]
MNEMTAYNLKEPVPNPLLTETTRGTPMGELLRRYWHPVGLSEDATATPKKIRALGEDLILFRDGSGTVGIVHPRCAHRGTSLYYGKVEDRGIRCCYHGWLFDAEGNCLEQPCEPKMGEGQREQVRQPWYPVEERYGLIWVYMGPPEKKPLLPRYELLENLDDGELLETDDTSIGGGGPVICDFNWFQHWENIIDPYHVVVLHGTFSGSQFVPEMMTMPDCHFTTEDLGVRTTSFRDLGDGKRLRRISEVQMPTLRVVPSPILAEGRCQFIGFCLPIDDVNFRIYTVGRVKTAGELRGHRGTRGEGKYWEDLTEAERREMPGDYEAQKGQGDITWHNHEHLGTTDQGIAMLRRFVLRQVKAVLEGGDPVGVAFEPGQEWIETPAGNWIEERV